MTQVTLLLLAFPVLGQCLRCRIINLRRRFPAPATIVRALGRWPITSCPAGAPSTIAGKRLLSIPEPAQKRAGPSTRKLTADDT